MELSHITFDYSSALAFFKEEEIYSVQDTVTFIHDRLHQRHGKMLGWVDQPVDYDRVEFRRIQGAAEKIQAQSDVLLVIGVGGSYLGARAAIEMLNHHFYNVLSKPQRRTPQIFYVGHNFSPVYIAELFELLAEKDFSINVISKSGTTLEPAIAFRIFRNLLEEKHGKAGARDRILVTTDGKKGVLKALADKEGYATFTVPDNIGGRYSVLTSVGLLPIAVSGVNIEEVTVGAAQARSDFNRVNLTENEAYQYAVIRNILYQKGKTIELLVHYDPSLHYLAEWWKQLFGESEGKHHKGIFPAAIQYSTDLHSMGQYIQEGRRDLFETIIKVVKPAQDFVIEKEGNDMDGLNFLAGQTLDYVNNQALEGARIAHTDGGVPNLLIEIPRLDAYTFGYLVYFFKKACAMSGHLHGVNPFDQPGVEEYKNNMFALLGKPGFEGRKEELKKRYLDTFEKV
ncbi:glucose-6-phosphate isomerase [Bacillus freudenreichii]|nr:glucose-6-phosphate isomerase [Bacillus freudenreichii]